MLYIYCILLTSLCLIGIPPVEIAGLVDALYFTMKRK